ncbi:MAG: AraC family ligand binding domain-containing protein [Clostridia bacterium]|nr:AraC family ligand binding domain-containing protein [Clostridia bacterium]
MKKPIKQVNKYLHQNLSQQEDSGNELTPIFYGYETCVKGQVWGPCVRSYYLIHFCVQGKGMLKDKRGTYKIHAGQLFIIRPEEATTYAPDPTDP